MRRSTSRNRLRADWHRSCLCTTARLEKGVKEKGLASIEKQLAEVSALYTHVKKLNANSENKATDAKAPVATAAEEAAQALRWEGKE
eukprot:989422-Pleurochrysis_carterae.AAC.1